MKKGFLKWVFTNIYFYLILSLWFVLILLLILFTEPQTTISDRILPILFMIPFMALMLLIPFMAAKFINDDRKKKDFPIKNWEWVVYIIGWLGVLSLIFWAYQYLFYLSKNYGDKFFSMNFHKRTYYWGWVIITLTVFAILAILSLLVSIF